MSTGHFHLTYRKPEEVKKWFSKVWGSQKFRDHLNQKFSVNREYDIPYVAGYSKSAKIVYIDRHLPLSLRITGQQVNVLPFIIEHERVEKAVLDTMGWDYEDAHKLATYAEHLELKRKGISPGAYERALDPYIKADEHEKIKRVPLDLDFKPYSDSRDEKLTSHMKAHQK